MAAACASSGDWESKIRSADEEVKIGGTKRPNRPAAARRQQYERAHAKSVQVLLRSFQALRHRGCQPTRFGKALRALLEEFTKKDEKSTKEDDKAETEDSADDRGQVQTLVAASEQGAGGAGGEKVFRTFAPRLFAEYKEQWIQSGSQWLLSQAMLHVFHVERPADGLDQEIFALHCEPAELGDSTQSLFKRSPHVHVKADRNRLGKAHIPLNYQNLDGVLASADSFGDAFAAAIDVVAIEIVDRLANA